MTVTVHLDVAGVPTLVLRGPGAPPRDARLVGRRASVIANVQPGESGWQATLPLEASRWGRPSRPLPSGEYRVVGVDVTAAAVPATMTSTLRIEVEGDLVRLGPPVDAAYAHGEGQAALERRYATRPVDLENAVFFESFYGRNASCNPRAIDRELARVAPGVRRYWSVVDLSVEVPDGAVAVIEGSPEWWRARGAARLLVVNDWLRRRYARRRGQTVLQTWHGTPLKKLALHRPGFDPRRMLAVIREARRWNVLLAQNAYGAGILRKAYAFLGRPIWVEGYPRNDVLSSADGAGIRAALGIGPSDRVLLYAPTWRDDRDQMVDFLDLPALAAAADATVLVRGHSRTLLPGSDATGARVVDVTGYPDISELLLVADALITDYSSVMFDFTATGKPVYFHVPDVEHYRGELRGFYFDLAAHAPGPVVATQEALEAALAEPTDAYAERYRRWRERFNARDDGHAAERVVARILDQGFIERA